MKLKGTVISTILMCVGIGVGLSLYQTKEIIEKKKVSLCFDALFSKTFQDEAFAFVREQEKIVTPLYIWAELFKERFSAVQHVHVHNIKHVILIKLKAYQPLSVINKDFVLLESGVLVPQHHFIKLKIQSLKSVTLMPKERGKRYVSSECKSFIMRCDTSLCKKYEMTWNSPMHIEFHNKDHENMIILATIDTDLGKKTEQQCGLIIDELLQDKKKKHKKWNIDMRFKNQIIVAMR